MSLKEKNRTGDKNRRKEKLIEIFFLLLACISIIAVVVICIFLFANGLPAILEIGVKELLFGTKWRPGESLYGIFPMIIGSIYATIGAILLGVPIGILTAVFMSKICPKKLYKVLKPAMELLAGIPSIVYGFFALVVIVPIIRQLFPGNGLSLFTACILLGIMILPTIIGVAESAIRAVPDSYYEGALALGATRERSLFFVVVPAAKSGIMTAVVLGLGRALGEAMAIAMVAGGAVNLPLPFNSVRFLTTLIVGEMSYSSGLHREVLFTIGLVLFAFILFVNIFLTRMIKKGEAE